MILPILLSLKSFSSVFTFISLIGSGFSPDLISGKSSAFKVKMTFPLAARILMRRSPSLHLRRNFARAAVEVENGSAARELPPFDYTPLPYAGPTADEILAKRREYLSPSILHSYKNPVSSRNTRLFPQKYRCRFKVFTMRRKPVFQFLYDFQNNFHILW